MKFLSNIKNEFLESELVLKFFINNEENFIQIGQAAMLMTESIQQGGKIISCGNGGSHCDAMHFAEELTGRYRNNCRPLPAIAISDPCYISCAANDFGYENVFSRFIGAMGNPGDILLAISTSGQSENITRAINCAKDKQMKVVVLTGNDGGKIKGKADVEIIVAHFGFADRIQEVHIKIIHAMILCIEQSMALT
ncbi:MAG TPA: D-sedoheptulose 7-phosphate isomerase [Chitinophagaceae bacterium]|nr:D-sedoheptulose 7-phosphate isomerase [Chitinophagaceae bacterium]